MWAGSSIKTWLGTVHSKKKVEGSSFRNYAKCACAAFHHWEGNACVPFQWFSRLYSDWFSTFEIVSDNPSIIWTSQIPSLMHRNYQTTQSLQPLTRKQCGLPFQFLSFQVWSGFSSLSIFHWILYAGSVFDISTISVWCQTTDGLLNTGQLEYHIFITAINIPAHHRHLHHHMCTLQTSAVQRPHASRRWLPCFTTLQKLLPPRSAVAAEAVRVALHRQVPESHDAKSI